MPIVFRLMMVAALAVMPWGTSAVAQDAAKGKAPPERSPDSEIARYCGAVEPSAAEARLNFNLKRLNEIEARVKEETAALKALESETREWVTKREELMKAATDDVVTIYSKMSTDAAATQISNMDDVVAASILSKLKPQAAGAILNEMDPDRASRLTTLMSGGAPEDKKS